MEKKIREDLWKAIQAHYERSDYTESIRDALFFTNELLREKSGLTDNDGTKLVEAALLGKNPVILVNKNETTTERDVQQGIGFAFKGIMQSVRNVISHEKTVYSENEAEAIILYINYLLNQIDHSGGVSKIDNLMELLYDDDFTNSKEYAELLLKEIPTKKRYDLLITLFNDRANLQQENLSEFIKLLFDSLTKASKSDFIRVISKTMMKCKDNMDLRMYFHYFMSFSYSELDKLAQLRIEDLIRKSVINGEMVRLQQGFSDEKGSNDAGSLATWVVGRLELLGNKDTIISHLFYKIRQNRNEQEYVFTYFSEYLFKNASDFSLAEIELINKELRHGNRLFIDWLAETIESFENQDYIRLFGDSYTYGKERLKKSILIP